MIQAICLGETLIDFISIKNNVFLAASPGFTKALGGAPTNVAVGLAKQGIPTAFIGKVGDDPFGHYLKQTLKHYRVNISGVLTDKNVRTTLAFVSRFSHGQNDFVFYRHPGADMMLKPNEIKEDYFKHAKIFHFGSISLINQPSRDATLKAIKLAQKHKLIISYDPNLRLSLWDSPAAARKGIWLGLQHADLAKISDQEWAFITGTKDFDRGSYKLLKHGIKLIVISLGAKGCYYNNGLTSGYIKGYKVKTVDTTGAGDGFMAAILAELLRKSSKKDKLKTLDLEPILRFANAAGALATTKMGATEGLPTTQAIKNFMSQRSKSWRN